MLLDDRVVIVTDGAKGLGTGIAERFAREGAKVTIADIALPEAEVTRQVIEAAGGTALVVECDVTSTAWVAGGLS